MEDFVKQQIDKIKEDCERLKPLTVIRCVTYNHEKYIRDALDGFVMQKTDFPFVAIVHDDASTDDTPKIVKEYAEKYPDIIKPIFEEENQYSKGNGFVGKVVDFACRLSGARYIAICEGDDYWIDSLKLQKQVNFLETNPDYSMCFHEVSKKEDDKVRKVNITGKVEDKDYLLEEIINDWIIPTCSVVMRNDVFLQKPVDKSFMVGDNVLWASCLKLGKIRGIKQNMAVYRRTDNGWTNQKTRTRKLRYETNLKWINHYQAMIKAFPELDTSVFEKKLVKFMADVSLVELLTLKKYGVRRTIGFYRKFGTLFLNQLCKSFIYTFKSKLKFSKKLLCL